MDRRGPGLDGLDALRERGLDAFRSTIRELAPFLGDRTTQLRDWDDVRLLRVQLNRLRRWWRPGLLCIGDAAHAMSPVAGVGINLAIQDAVAAAASWRTRSASTGCRTSTWRASNAAGWCRRS